MPWFTRLALVSLFTLGTLMAVPGRVRACNFKPYPTDFATSGPPPNGAQAPAPPTSTKVEVTRSKHAPPGNGDCGEVGSIQFEFTLAGAAWPGATLGIRLRLVSGILPDLMTLPDKPLLVQDGSLIFVGSDDPAQPFDFTVQATTVDASGVESAPITIHATSTGKSDGGCSFVPHGKSPPVVLLLLLGLFLFARAKARKCSTN